jgi:hypothetical protein
MTNPIKEKKSKEMKWVSLRMDARLLSDIKNLCWKKTVKFQILIERALRKYLEDIE